MNDMNVEDFLPHRGRMKLIDRIVHLNSDTVETVSVVNAQWPLFEKNHVSSIVLVELVAQTAGIYISRKKEKEITRTGNERGWVVGIKSASFFTDRMMVNTMIRTTASFSLQIDSYMQINGHTYVEQNLIGKINLQIFWVESGDGVKKKG